MTLMPLNRLAQRKESVAYPKADDCRPLIQFLQYDPAVAPAVEQVRALCHVSSALRVELFFQLLY